MKRHYKLGEQDKLDEEMPLCVKRDVGIIIGGVFSSGLYAMGPVAGANYNYVDASPAELDKARKISAVCARYNGPLPAAALQFPLLHPQVTSVIPGAFAPSQVTDNLDHVRREISAALWQELQHDGLIRADVPISAA